MSQSFIAENWMLNDVPDGGFAKLLTEGDPFDQPAMMIRWQRGPLVVNGVRQEPNGAFVETVIEAAIQRVEFYQDTKFACEENQAILDHLYKAIAWCHDRTARREARQVEGTNEP